MEGFVVDLERRDALCVFLEERAQVGEGTGGGVIGGFSSTAGPRAAHARGATGYHCFVAGCFVFGDVGAGKLGGAMRALGR